MTRLTTYLMTLLGNTDSIPDYLEQTRPNIYKPELLLGKRPFTEDSDDEPPSVSKITKAFKSLSLQKVKKHAISKPKRRDTGSKTLKYMMAENYLAKTQNRREQNRM